MEGKVYFITDAHFGSLALSDNREREILLVQFLDSIKTSARAVYLLGDMFDFWYEFKYAVPKGFTRFLGKLSELTDSGVEVHYFVGNHDVWAFEYLHKECGVILHFEPEEMVIHGKRFYMAHGDGVGDPDKSFRLLRSLFRNKTCQFLFSLLPTRWSLFLGEQWAKKSMNDHRLSGGVVPYQGEEREHTVLFAKEYLLTHPDVNFFVFGHRHIELDLMLSRTSRIVILGDWITHFTYAEFDGQNMTLTNYVFSE